MWRPLVVLVSRLRDLFARRRLAREAEQEIELHLDLLAAQYVRAGNTPAEARRLARAKFGGVIAPRAPIVAVVDDMKYQGLAAPRAGSFYVPWPRVPTGVSHLVVRTSGDPMALAPAIRDLIRTLNPSLPVPEVRTLEDHVAGSIADRRLRVLPAAGFASLALAVAMVGLFGALGAGNLGSTDAEGPRPHSAERVDHQPATEAGVEQRVAGRRRSLSIPPCPSWSGRAGSARRGELVRGCRRPSPTSRGLTEAGHAS